MPDESPLPRPLRIFRASAIVVSVLVVILMGITGWRIREARLRAKYGVEPGEVFTIAAGGHVQLERFRIEYDPMALRVLREDRRMLCAFTRVRAGERRGWQELQLDVLEVSPGRIRLDAFLRPGSPCFGSGQYRDVKPGLRIEFPGDRAVTVLEVPGEQWRVSVASPGGEEELTFPWSGNASAAGLRVEGIKTMGKGPGPLLVEETD